ncbi:MAG: PrgI family protein [Candidatus Kerfeldbacteria bacterium]|nr:PrgI family protein [Candidatus Kerfeldbacteria bacterium]
MQFVVPQFIDVEDKILGPISVRQFIVMIIGTGFLIAAYRFADFGLFLIEAVIIVVLTMAFAFLRVNGRPFHYFLINFVQTLKRPKLRIWKQEVSKTDLRLPKVVRPHRPSRAEKPPVTTSRLAELALVVDTGGAYKAEDYD